jgi:hypothetical protein
LTVKVVARAGAASTSSIRKAGHRSERMRMGSPLSPLMARWSHARAHPRTEKGRLGGVS